MSNRAFILAILLLAVAGTVACWCDTAMLWDGAYQLCETLVTGRPFAYLSRFHSWVVWQPVALLAPHTENGRLLRLLYGFPYCFAPLSGVALSWWAVRRSAPHLTVWALFGIALAPLPGQIFMINDSVFQLHLFWPVLMVALVPADPVRRWTLGALSLFQLSHPMGIGLCLFAAAASLAVRRRLGWPVWLLALALGGWVKLVLWPDQYAASEATLEQVRNTFIGGVRGWPLTGLLAVWGAGALLLLPRAGKAAWGAVLLLALAGGCWLIWASDPHQWRGAVNYRRWVAPAAFPFMLAIVGEAWRGGTLSAPRSAAGVMAALVFTLVLGAQSLDSRKFFRSMSAAVAAEPGPWIDASAFPWMKDTALEHWGLPAQVLMVQGSHPHACLRGEEALRAAAERPPRILLKEFDARDPALYPGSWFRWAGLPGRP